MGRSTRRTSVPFQPADQSTATPRRCSEASAVRTASGSPRPSRSSGTVPGPPEVGAEAGAEVESGSGRQAWSMPDSTPPGPSSR